MKEKLKPYILLSPLFFIVFLIFVVGILTALVQSLGYFKIIGLEEFTFKYYIEVLRDKSFLESLSFSLYTSFLSSLISTILGLLLAYSIYRSASKEKYLELIYKIPIAVPHLIAVLIVYTSLSQTGILSRLLYMLGLIEDPSSLSFLLYNENGIGIILAYMWKEIPFVAFTSYLVLNRMNDDLYNAAKNLGASSRQAFFHVILPLVLPSVFSSFVIIFAFSFGAYEIPFLLGPTFPKALPVKAFIEYSNPTLTNRPYAMAINIIITSISLIIAWIYFKLFERINKYEEDQF